MLHESTDAVVDVWAVLLQHCLNGLGVCEAVARELLRNEAVSTARISLTASPLLLSLPLLELLLLAPCLRSVLLTGLLSLPLLCFARRLLARRPLKLGRVPVYVCSVGCRRGV